MNTFLKTFFVCLVITFSFLAYKFFAVDSYSTDLHVSKNNPVFGTHSSYNDAKPVAKTDNNSKESDFNPVIEKKADKYQHKCYFYSNSGELILVKRELSFKQSLENTITLLLKGPNISEVKKGIYSEIPSNVDLIGVTRQNNSVVINLSSNFGYGGGTNSIMNRVKQLSKTVKLIEPNKEIYLYIDGKEVEYLGGDGVFIKQPLE